MKLKELLNHTQDFIAVRVEECGKLVAEKTPRILIENLSADRLGQTVGLINGAGENKIRVSIIPQKAN